MIKNVRENNVLLAAEHIWLRSNQTGLWENHTGQGIVYPGLAGGLGDKLPV